MDLSSHQGPSGRRRAVRLPLGIALLAALCAGSIGAYATTRAAALGGATTTTAPARQAGRRVLAIGGGRATGGAVPAATATGPLTEGIPHFAHVFNLIFENKSRDEIWYPGYISATQSLPLNSAATGVITPGTPSMDTMPITANTPNPYLNSLVPKGAFMSQYYGQGHFSDDNYIAATSGQSPNPTTNADCPVYSVCLQSELAMTTTAGAYNITDQLDKAGLSWKAYMDGMPAPCTHAGATSTGSDPYVGNNALGNYADRHDPFIYYPSVEGNQALCESHVVPITDSVTSAGIPTTGLLSDLQRNTLPNYAWITPDTCNDAHDTPNCFGHTAGTDGLQAADRWLQNTPAIGLLLNYVQNPANNAVLYLIFDESDIRTAMGPVTTDFGTVPVNLLPSDAQACCAGGDSGTGGAGGGGLIGALAIGAHIVPGTGSTVQHDQASLLRTEEDTFGLAMLNDAASPLETGHAMTEIFTSTAAATATATITAPATVPAAATGTPAVAASATAVGGATATPTQAISCGLPCQPGPTVVAAPSASPAPTLAPGSTATAAPSTSTSTSTPAATFTPVPSATASRTATPGVSVAPAATPTRTPPPAATSTPAAPGPAPTLTLPGVPLGRFGPTSGTHLSFAGGYDAPDQPASLSLVNKTDHAATVHAVFIYTDGATRAANVTVGAASQRTVPVARLVARRGSFGLVVSAGGVVAAQLNLARHGRDGDVLAGAARPERRWYLAEGYTGLTFRESVALLNASPSGPATVTLRLLRANGRGGRTVTVAVPPHTQRTVDINRLLPGAAVSIVATADAPIVVERTLVFGRGGYGLTTRLGVPAAATRWLFAEGTTVNRFQTYLTILNPGGAAARVVARFYDGAGRLLATNRLTAAPGSRATVSLGGLLRASGIASVVSADRPIVVERPEYFGAPNGRGIPGSDVFGLTAPSPSWSFPGGDAAARDEYLLLFNPGGTAVPVRVTLYTGSGSTATYDVTLAARERGTLEIGRVFAAPAGVRGLSVASTDGQGFIAEQTVFAPDHTTLDSTEGVAP